MFIQKPTGFIRPCWAFLTSLLLAAACGQPDAPREQSKVSILTIDSLTGEPVPMPNPWKNAGCKLVTDEEVIELFNIDVDRYAFNARTLPNRGFCLRTWLKPNWKELESANEKPGAVYREFKNTLVTQVLDYGTAATSNDQFELVRRDQRDMFEEDVYNLGEAAIWSTSQLSLMVKKGQFVIKITIDYAERPHGNLKHAIDVAKLALPKM